MKIKEKTYKPPKILTYFFIAVIALMAFLIFKIHEISFITVSLAILSVIFILGSIDLSLSKIIYKESDIEITNSFKKEIIKMSDIKRVKIEDHELFLYMKNSKIKRLPSWFTGRKSLYKLIDNNLKTYNE